MATIPKRQYLARWETNQQEDLKDKLYGNGMRDYFSLFITLWLLNLSMYILAQEMCIHDNNSFFFLKGKC